MTDVVEVIQDVKVISVVQPTTSVVQVVERGLQGPQGPLADQANVAGYVQTAVDDYFVTNPAWWEHEQIVPAGTWQVLNPLGRPATVAVYDTAGQQVYPDVFITDTGYRLEFANATAGKAVLT